MLSFEGDREFAQAPADLWGRLSDARFLVRCIPDVEEVSRAEPQAAACKVRPGFSFARGTLELTLQVGEAEPAASVRVEVRSRGIGSSSTVEAALTLAPQGNGTRLHWTAAVRELGGLLKAVPQGLIKAAAQKVIDDLLAAVDARLAG